jgi:hypothetical protein
VQLLLLIESGIESSFAMDQRMLFSLSFPIILNEKHVQQQAKIHQIL